MAKVKKIDSENTGGEVVDVSILASVVSEKENNDFGGVEGSDEAPIPDRLSYEWNDYVMGQFHRSELVTQKDNWGKDQKYPRVHGLRRLAQKYVGDIVESVAECVSPPNLTTHGAVGFCSFLYRVKFLKLNHSNKNLESDYVTYSDGADIVFTEKVFNADPNYARFPTAFAITRAESRVYRKALGLSTCSAEELAPKEFKGFQGENTQVPTPTEIDPDKDTEFIDNTQENWLDVNFNRANVDAWKLLGFVNKGAKIAKVNKIPFNVAKDTIRIVQGFLRAASNGQDGVSEFEEKNKISIKGFQKGWKG